MSEVVVQQGDPLGPMGYCTSTHKLLQAVQTTMLSSILTMEWVVQ